MRKGEIGEKGARNRTLRGENQGKKKIRNENQKTRKRKKKKKKDLSDQG